ncbi:hypothetical protein K2X33_05330 [bacterium]|nr:hypothetical protein [bacterium]
MKQIALGLLLACSSVLAIPTNDIPREDHIKVTEKWDAAQAMPGILKITEKQFIRGLCTSEVHTLRDDKLAYKQWGSLLELKPIGDPILTDRITASFATVEFKEVTYISKEKANLVDVGPVKDINGQAIYNHRSGDYQTYLELRDGAKAGVQYFLRYYKKSSQQTSDLFCYYWEALK